MWNDPPREHHPPKETSVCLPPANLEEGSLARDVFEEQKSLTEVPSLFNETKEHFMKMGIESPTGYSKYQYKRIVKKYIEKRNKKRVFSHSKC